MSEVQPIPKKRKTRKKANVTKQADALFGALVRSLGYCEACGGTEVIQCAHGFSRSYRATRWDFRNCFALCRACHLRFTVRPIEWDEWMRERMGPELYAEIRSLALSSQKVDVLAVIADLKRVGESREESA